VRLDHLLSKESLAPSRGECSRGCPLLTSGALVIHSAAADEAVSRLRSASAAERACGGGGWVSTLLGPEEAGVLCSGEQSRLGLKKRPVRFAGWIPGGAGWFRPFLENCTVDASIF
jgi:hypothetical protein